MKAQVPVNIFQYTDYRLYLKEYHEARKSVDRKFSHRYIREKVGASSAGWFADLVKGRIRLTDTYLLSLAKLLDLKAREIEYFEAMVRYDQAATVEERNRCFEKMMSFRELSQEIIGANRFEFYRVWYYTAIRELLLIYKFRGNHEELARKLSPEITPEQAQHAIRLLEELEFIQKDDSGVYKPTTRVIKKDSNFKYLHLANFLISNMQMGIEALDRYGKDDRDISAVTMTFSANSFRLAQEKIKILRKELLALSERDTESERVYQCNIQLFPLTK